MALIMYQVRNNMSGPKHLSVLHSAFSIRLAPLVSNVLSPVIFDENNDIHLIFEGVPKTRKLKKLRK